MIVATIASLANRHTLLQQTIRSLEPQVDAICVYLNGHEQIPEFLRQPKVLHAVMSKDAGWRGAEAKLWWWDRTQFKAAPAWRDDDVALVCDDDILYPTDYVEKMVACLDRHPGSIVCVHGSIVIDPFVSYADSRWIARSSGPLSKDCQIHIPGSGTMAFRRGDVDFRIDRDFPWSHCVDVCVALAAKRDGVECWSLPRRDLWLRPFPIPGRNSIFNQRTGARNDSVETKLIADAQPWPQLDAGAVGLVTRASNVLEKRIKPNVRAMLPSDVAPWMASRLEGKVGYVVELGSGHGSTRLSSLLPKTLRLISVEHNKQYVGLVPGPLYVYAPIRDGWYDRGVLEKHLPKPDQIAAVVVDGPPKAIGRRGILNNLDLFSPLVPMLFDDVHRELELQLANEVGARRSQPVEIHQAGDRAFATVGWES